MSIRRRSAAAVLAVTLAGSAAAVTAAAASALADSGGNPSVGYCRSIASLFPGDIYGACVSYYQSHNRSAAATDVYFCKNEFVPDGYFDNLGQ